VGGLRQALVVSRKKRRGFSRDMGSSGGHHKLNALHAEADNPEGTPTKGKGLLVPGNVKRGLLVE